MQGLPPEMIADLMANSRSRGIYGPKLLEFCESDEPAINPAESWPLEFHNKKASSLYQSFNAHIKKAKLEEVVQCKLYNDQVFLLHLERTKVFMAAQAEAQAA